MKLNLKKVLGADRSLYRVQWGHKVNFVQVFLRKGLMMEMILGFQKDVFVRLSEITLS